MNILRELQELDDIIVEHTKPPVTPMLRNKLAFCIDQASAHTDAVERQSQTLSTQHDTIERLMKEKAAVDFKLHRLEQAVSDGLQQSSDDYWSVMQKGMLNHDV